MGLDISIGVMSRVTGAPVVRQHVNLERGGKSEGYKALRTLIIAVGRENDFLNQEGLFKACGQINMDLKTLAVFLTTLGWRHGVAQHRFSSG